MILLVLDKFVPHSFHKKDNTHPREADTLYTSPQAHSAEPPSNGARDADRQSSERGPPVSAEALYTQPKRPGWSDSSSMNTGQYMYS